MGSFGFELEGWKFKPPYIIFNMGIARFGYEESLIWGFCIYTIYHHISSSSSIVCAIIFSFICIAIAGASAFV